MRRAGRPGVDRPRLPRAQPVVVPELDEPELDAWPAHGSVVVDVFVDAFTVFAFVVAVP